MEFDRVVAQCDQAQKTRGESSNTSLANNQLGLITASSASGVLEAGPDASSPHVNNKISEIVTEMVANVGQGIDVVPSCFSQEVIILPRQTHEKLREIGVPQFFSKLYEIVDDPNTDYLVQWGFDGQSFLVHDANAFCDFILPKYFKHNHFFSFTLQLHHYGFQKIDAAKWEYANEEFQRGKKHLLRYIKRRISGNRMEFESEKQDETLKDAQIANLSKQMSAFEERMQLIELEYKKIACFLSQTIQNPGFIAELIRGKASLEAKPSEQEMATAVSDDTTKVPSASNHILLVNAQTTPNQTTTGMKTYVGMTYPSFGESSSSPAEAQGSAKEMALNSLESQHDELMNASEACDQGFVDEQFLDYFPVLESLIDEESDGWDFYEDAQPIDRKP
uniref:HSF-type DNA-binding domain-containing protein n=1 Tax=Kalanchoe fedtschenkoi TaxID=63787 RepID=A0A7N0TMY3_KALFE